MNGMCVDHSRGLICVTADVCAGSRAVMVAGLNMRRGFRLGTCFHGHSECDTFRQFVEPPEVPSSDLTVRSQVQHKPPLL